MESMTSAWLVLPLGLEISGGLLLFAFVSSITPGPNNLMLMASGANFGVVRTTPHLLGVGLGFVLMVLLVGLGLAELLERFPGVALAMRALSAAFVLWLAWKLLGARMDDDEVVAGEPLTFLQAAGFQWINPKAWAMALTAASIYAPSGSLGAVLTVALLFGLVNLPSVGTWVLVGRQLRGLLNTPVRLRVFNCCMAVLLIGSTLPVVFTAA